MSWYVSTPTMSSSEVLHYFTFTVDYNISSWCSLTVLICFNTYKVFLRGLTLTIQHRNSLITVHPEDGIVDVETCQVWEPLTKQFYSECQLSGDQPSSQSAWSTAALISIGPCPALGIQWTRLHQVLRTICEDQAAMKNKESQRASSTSQLQKHSPDCHGRSYTSSAASQPVPVIRIAATWTEHTGLPSNNAAAHSLLNRPFSGLIQTFMCLIPLTN
jgi:hypothetical protein